MSGFANSYEHLLAELERIDLLIRARVAHVRAQQNQDEHFRGLYISEQEVDVLMAQSIGRPSWLRAADNGWLDGLDARLQEMAQRLELRRGAGDGLRLEHVRCTFGLSRFETDVLLVCLASELDLRYEKLYAYLQDDVTRKRPSVELVIQLLTRSDADRLAARRSLHADGPLLRTRLVHLLEDSAQPSPPLLGKFVKIDDGLVQYLLGGDAVDERLREFVELAAPGATAVDALRVEDDTRRAIRQSWPAGSTDLAPVVVLRGPAGAGKRTAALASCSERQVPLLMVNAGVLAATTQDCSERMTLVQREAMLRGGALYWYGLDTLSSDPDRARIAAVARGIDNCPVPCLVGTREVLEATSLFPKRGSVLVMMPELTHGQRIEMWSASVAGRKLGDDADLAAIASRFRLSVGQIKHAAATAGHLSRVQGGSEAPVAYRHLLEACRLHSNQKLASLARKVPPHYRWDDIVLPPDRLEQLREICNQVRYRDRVLGDWGFGRKFALGKGLAVLFSGPSGTGKTMAAGIIAGELGLDLYKIDLSTVISKYIGETEKNLGRIFDEAETSNAILFFDEADALFGKRSEVRDSHDRYANIEVGFLLQRMEEYAGVAIMATNLRRNIDEAFVRRLHFTVEFPFPDVAHRHRIWKGVWPTDAPRDPGLDLQALAERYEMTGGNIKNVAVAAAFLAADDGEVVRAIHLLRALRREYQKTGKLLVDESDPAAAEEEGMCFNAN